MKQAVKKITTIKKLVGKPKGVSFQYHNLDDLILPTEPKEIATDFNAYTILFYGREKIGKSTLCASFPEALFFGTEPGTKGLPIYEFNSENGGVTDWSVFQAGVKLLEKNKGQFKTVIIDTADRAYDLCLDWVCKDRHIEYPSDDEWGKAWRAVKQEFMEQIHRILQTGRGVVFVSHAREQEIKTQSGLKYTRIFPTMSAQARTVIEALVDCFFYCEYMKDATGQTIRVLICEGDETIWAGARATPAGSFPAMLPMRQKNGYEIIQRAFMGEAVGLDIRNLKAARTTSASASLFLGKKQIKGGKN
jgi:hypothetical protein